MLFGADFRMAENLKTRAVPTWSQLHKRGVARLQEAATLSSPEETGRTEMPHHYPPSKNAAILSSLEETGRRRDDSVCQQEPPQKAATSQNRHLNPDTASRRILAEISGCEMSELLSIWHDPAPELAAARYEQMLQRLQAGEPLQYVLGSWGFRYLDLFLDNRVLIPRPETEIVVEVALGELANRHQMLSNQSASQGRATAGTGLPPRLLAADLGCGSGAIGLSLAAEYPNAEVICTDISSDALAVTRANLAGIGTAGMRVRLAQGSWYKALEKIPSSHRPTALTQNSQDTNLPKTPKKSTTNSNPAPNTQDNSLKGKLDLIVSNPPYIADHEQLPEIITAHEPANALYAGPKGTEAIHALLSEAPQWLAPGGSIVCEIAPHQAEAATKEAQANGLTNIKILPDLANRPRVLRAQCPSPLSPSPPSPPPTPEFCEHV